MIRTTPSGYEIQWSQNGNSNISRMTYDGVDFLAVSIEFFNHSWMVEISVEAIPTHFVGTHASPVMLTGKFSTELLEDFGIDLRNYNEVAKDPERFLLNVIKETSNMGYWKKTMNSNMYKKYQTPKIKKDYYLHDNPFHVPSRPTSVIPQEIKDSLKEKDATIAELTEELEELKKELETMRAMMEEC